ncbi:single-stranded-DNA-specific exonuclease RecJ [Caminibacter sp.]
MLTKDKIRRILSNRIEELSSLNLPHFSLLNDITKASLRIKKAVEKKEKIVVVGDYDVDGVVSSSIMHLFFKNFYDNFEIVIPDRFEEGYGLSPKLLERIKADLIITVDNGITSFEAAKICKEKGIDLIITDHHTPVSCDNLPKAYAIVNPKTSPDFPFKEICGAEVAWYLCAALKHQMKLNTDLREFLDMLSIAVIADVMPLTHMNRTLVNMGLKRLNRALKPFSAAIKRFFQKELKSEDIAFQVAPRLNAAGRVSHASLAFRFLISQNDEEAFKLWLELDGINNKRKEIEKNILEQIKIDESDGFLVVEGDFHEGVVGIIASRLVHRYKKPAIVLSKTAEGYKGSGRSLGNIDIFEMVEECSDILEGFGGHKMACGLKLKEKNLKFLKEKLNEKVKKYQKEDFYIEDFVLGELPFKEIDYDLYEILKEFEPYGEGNPKPKFTAEAKVEYVYNLKDNHYKLVLSQEDCFLPAVIFNFDEDFEEYIKFKFSVGFNDYNNEIQLIIEEIL